MLVVPRNWRGFTPEWMTAALARSHPGVVVERVETDGIESGTSRRATVHLSYRSDPGPASVFVKWQGRLPQRLALTALGALYTEARVAGSGVDLPIERPALYAADIDRIRGRSVVVMEDVTVRGGRPNRATTALPVAEVRSGLGELARLHAAFADRPGDGALGFLRPWRLGSGWAAVSAVGLSVGRSRLTRADPATAAALPAVARLERQFRATAALAATGPATVLHGDPHPGNTFALPGGRTGFYDWQLARIGHWSHDVGYFLVSSLDPPERRLHERELLDGYRAARQSAGGPSPAASEAWSRYRAAPAYGLGAWLHTLAAGRFQPVDVAVATLRRFAAAYTDLETDRSVVAD